MAKKLIISGKTFLEKKYKTYPFEGPFKDLFGVPEVNFKLIIAGDPKQGKSTLSLHYFKYLTESFGKGLYVSYEQGFAFSLQDVVRRVYSEAEPKNAYFGRSMSFEELKDKIKKNHYRFIFIDSIQWAKFTEAQYKDLVNSFPHKSFIFISYKNFPKFFEHAVDTTCVVKEGLASSFGRYGSG